MPIKQATCNWAAVAGFAIVFFISTSATATDYEQHVAPAGVAPGITVSGQTHHPRLPSASVEVVFGSETVTGTTDTDGKYSIDMNCNENDAVVFVYVQGSGEFSHVKASRVVDSCAELNAAAGPSETFEVGTVSPVSTAAYAILRWYVDSVASLDWPPDVDDMLAHRHVVSGFYVMNIMGALPSMIAEHLPLPDGMETTLDLLLDRPALVEYADELIDQVDETVLDSARQAVFWDARMNFRTEVLSELSSLNYYCPPIQFSCIMSFWDVSGVDYYALAGASGGLADVEFRELLDMVFSDGYELPEDNLRALRIRGEDGQPLSETVSFAFVPDVGQVEAIFTVQYQDLRVLDASEILPLGSVVEKTTTTYPGGELPDEESISEFPAVRNVVRSDVSLPSWSGPQGGETWHMPLFLDPADEVASASNFRWDGLSFQIDGTGQTALSDLSFDWSMVDGALEIDGPDIDTHRYRLLGGDLDRHPLFKVTYRPASDEVRSGVYSMVLDNDPPAFTDETVVGRYYGGFGSKDELALLPMSGFPIEHLVFHFDEGGTGWRAFMTDPEQPEKPGEAEDFTWSVDDNDRLVIERPLNELFDMHRAWSPMALHGPTGLLYVNEVGPVFSDDPGFELPNIPGRLNLYRQIDLP